MTNMKERIEESLDLLEVYAFDYPLDIKPTIKLIKDLAAENQRYQEALELIINDWDNNEESILEIAKAALKGE